MNHLWQGAVRDEAFYTQLQFALGITLRYEAKGKGKEDPEHDPKRLARMIANYKTFFGGKEPLMPEPLIPEASYVARPCPSTHLQPSAPAFVTQRRTQSPEPKRTMQIFVRLRHAKRLPVFVQPSDLAVSVKRVVEQRKRYPLERQRLIWAGEHLDDGRSLESYGIKEWSTLYLWLVDDM